MKQQTKPKISIVMSTYNEPLNWVTESIDSILNQTFTNFEFIIINDKPERKELQEFLEKYQKQDKRIVLIKNEKNIGLTKSLNKGLKKARGKYIARMDADDISLPKRFEIQYNYLENNPSIDVLGTGSQNIDEAGNKGLKFKPLTNPIKIKKLLLLKNCFYHPSIMFRNKNYLYREKFIYAQDYDLYLNLISRNKNLSNLPEPLIKYRINPNAISWSKKGKQRLFHDKAIEFYNQKLKYGRDYYERFNPQKIIDIDIERTTNPTLLKQEIYASFKINDFKKVKKFCKKYFRSKKYFDKILIYYFLSFTGKKFVNLIRKIIF